jgi:hypothetical protein
MTDNNERIVAGAGVPVSGMNFWHGTRAELGLACLVIGTRRCGAVALGLGHVVVVFGQQPPGPARTDNTLAQRELDLVRKGLIEAGAEEICGLTFGGGYLLFVHPQDGDLGADGGRGQEGWSRHERFTRFTPICLCLR